VALENDLVAPEYERREALAEKHSYTSLMTWIFGDTSGRTSNLTDEISQ